MKITRLTKNLLDEISKILLDSNKGKTGLEIERRFLVKSLPNYLDKFPHEEIEQGYLESEDGTSIRLRKTNNKYYQTTKLGTGKIRTETEVEISKNLFNSLWPLTKHKRLTKTRYEIPHKAEIIQLDIYHGKLEGFTTVEIEFESEDECDKLTPPDWFGKEVTGDKRYGNKNLAVNGVPR